MKKSKAKHRLKIPDVTAESAAAHEELAPDTGETGTSKVENIASSSKICSKADDKKYLQYHPEQSVSIINPAEPLNAVAKTKSEPMPTENKIESKTNVVTTNRDTPKLVRKHYSETSFMSTEVSLRTVEGSYDVANMMPILQKGKASYKIDASSLEKRSTVPEMLLNLQDESSDENDVSDIDYLKHKSTNRNPSTEISILQEIVVSHEEENSMSKPLMSSVLFDDLDTTSSFMTVEKLDVASSSSYNAPETYVADKFDSGLKIGKESMASESVAGPSEIRATQSKVSLEDWNKKEIDLSCNVLVHSEISNVVGNVLIDLHELRFEIETKEEDPKELKPTLDSTNVIQSYCAENKIDEQVNLQQGKVVAIEARQFVQDFGTRYKAVNDAQSISIMANIEEITRELEPEHKDYLGEKIEKARRSEISFGFAGGDHLSKQTEVLTSGTKSDSGHKSVKIKEETEDVSSGLWDYLKNIFNSTLMKVEFDSMIDERQYSLLKMPSERILTSHNVELEDVQQTQGSGSDTESAGELTNGLWDTMKALLNFPQMKQDVEYTDQQIQAEPSTSFDKAFFTNQNLKFKTATTTLGAVSGSVDSKSTSLRVLKDMTEATSSPSSYISPRVKTPKSRDFILLKANVLKVFPGKSIELTTVPVSMNSSKHPAKSTIYQSAPSSKPIKKQKIKRKTKGVQTEPIEFEKSLESICECPLGAEKLSLTGMFADGVRRTDLVLVLRNVEDKRDVESAKLTYLQGLVKAGLQMEAEAGIAYKNLIFVKLHASDTLLNTYAEPFGAQKRFRTMHERYISRCNCISWLFMFCNEREWIRSLRETYKQPLQMSNQERSYVVYMLLLYNKFGTGPKQFGLQNLIKKRIVVDAFSLHDGPYQLPLGSDRFNARQILYTQWAGIANVLWIQPKYLLHEYFGPKLAFFFTFYELCNWFLLAAGLWGVFMMIVYQTLDESHTKPLRKLICESSKKFNVSKLPRMNRPGDWDTILWWYVREVGNAECEGHKNRNICPYTWIQNYCLDMEIIKYFDNPFLIIYSIGIAGLGVLFLVYWRRLESFWVWVTEEDNEASSGRYFVRPSYKAPPQSSIRKVGDWPPVVIDWTLGLIRFLIFDIFFPICVIVIPLILVFIAFIWGYEGTRLWSAKDGDLWEKKDIEARVIPALINKYMEYAVYMAVTAAVHLALYVLEQLLHVISYYGTALENHRTRGSYEDNLIMSYSWCTFHCITPAVLYFAFLKGAFYHTPIAYWDVVFNITPPWTNKTYSFNLTNKFPKYEKLLRMAASLNCVRFSCFRQAVAVFFVVVILRVVIVDIAHFLLRRLKIFFVEVFFILYGQILSKWKGVSACEREYMMPRVTHHQILLHYNRLVMQMALVVLFAPLFPPGPLLLFLLNIWDMRDKAHIYLVHSRRPLLEKTRGIGAWNQQITLLFLALPIVHGIINARTEVFEKLIYLRYSNSVSVSSRMPYNDFLIVDNYNLRNLTNYHKVFGGINFNRTEKSAFREGQLNYSVKFYCELEGTRHLVAPFTTCRVYGYMERINGYDQHEWPLAPKMIAENYSMTAPMPQHYEWMHFKTVYLALFLMLVVLTWIIFRRCFGKYSASVQRMRVRERQLRRLQLPLTARH